jgi:hypothetical protein
MVVGPVGAIEIKIVLETESATEALELIDFCRFFLTRFRIHASALPRSACRSSPERADVRSAGDSCAVVIFLMTTAIRRTAGK